MQEQRDKLPDFIKLEYRTPARGRTKDKAVHTCRMAGLRRDPLKDVHNRKTNAFAGLGDFWERKLVIQVYEETTGSLVEAHLEFNQAVF